VSDPRPSERRLTPDERAQLRADLFAEIDRVEHRSRRRRRRLAGAGVVLAAVAVLGIVALRTPHAPTTDTAGSIPVRCTTGGTSAPDGVITASARHDPRLVCSELWRRGELVGGTRKSAPLTACARTDAREVLVLVTSDGGDGCRGTTSQQ
jgi:hypothetical protein